MTRLDRETGSATTFESDEAKEGGRRCRKGRDGDGEDDETSRQSKENRRMNEGWDPRRSRQKGNRVKTTERRGNWEGKACYQPSVRQTLNFPIHQKLGVFIGIGCCLLCFDCSTLLTLTHIDHFTLLSCLLCCEYNLMTPQRCLRS